MVHAGGLDELSAVNVRGEVAAVADIHPLLVFIAVLSLWRWLEARFIAGRGYHNLLDRPRDAPFRTAIGYAVATEVFLVFLAGSADRVDVLFGLPYVPITALFPLAVGLLLVFVAYGLPYVPQIWAYRVIVIVGPFIAAFLAYRVCVELQSGELVEHERERAEVAARSGA